MDIINCWTHGSLSSPKNICSVLQRPIPSAPNSIALLASSGVSAFAHIPNFLVESAHSKIVDNSFVSLGDGVIVFIVPVKISPDDPSILIMS